MIARSLRSKQGAERALANMETFGLIFVLACFLMCLTMPLKLFAVVTFVGALFSIGQIFMATINRHVAFGFRYFRGCAMLLICLAITILKVFLLKPPVW